MVDVQGYAISKQLMHQVGLGILILWGMLLLAGCEDENGYDTSPQEGTIAKTDTQRTASQADDSAKRIVVLGNSIAAGYGIGEDLAFPAILQDKIDASGWNAEVINAGVSGETTAGGLRRLDWLLDQRIDVLVVELGGNDGLRGTPVEHTRKNLQKIIDRTQEEYPDVRIILAGMQLPPSMGEEYTREFRQIYPDLAERNNVELVPFVLEGVGGNPALNQPDGIHPTAEGQRIVAENVWDVLAPVLASMEAESAVLAE